MTVGLLVTSLLLGLRHGVDWDHIAAITELSNAAPTRRRGLILSFIYALGHGVTVAGLGAGLLLFGAKIPERADAWLGRVVGATLITLGIWIVVELIRQGRDFRLRSRWVLIFTGTFAGFRRVRDWACSRTVSIEHEHEHESNGRPGAHGVAQTPDSANSRDSAVAHDHSHETQAAAIADQPLVPAGTTAGRIPQSAEWRWPLLATHSHMHRHDLALPTHPGARYESRTAAGIGVVHGIGLESPTQIAIFVASTSVAGAGFGLILLLVWIVGLMAANTVLALLAASGLLHAERNFAVYGTITVLIATGGIVIGSALLAGFELA